MNNKHGLKQKIIAKALERLNHPSRPAKIKVETLFEQYFKKYIFSQKK
jgi:hypothetical protein